jgi:hypothetical protein
MTKPNAGWLLTLILLGVPGVFRGECHAQQLPQARLDRIFPLGGAAGSVVVLDIAGRDIDDVKTLHFDHSGLKAEFVKPNQFRVTIAADTSVGTHEVRAVGKYGISGSRLFAVCRGLTEVRQAAEGNGSRDKAQAVPMNAAVNGSSRSNAADFFRFPARRGERVTIDCQAFRLDSQLQPVLVLTTAGGEVLARGTPYHGRTDVLIDFDAPADGEYVLEVRDILYIGDRPYRLVISNRPRFENAFPPAIRPGETVQLTLLGRNLPGGKPSPNGVVPRTQLEELRLTFTAPVDATCLQRLDFINHPPSPSLNARALQFWPRGIADALNPVTLAFADAPVSRELEPNDSAETAQAIALPAVICGRFDRPGDTDWYSFTAKAGQVIAIDLLCERLGMPGDPVVIVRNAKGAELAAFDDSGMNSDALTQLNRDPSGTFAIPEDGTYRLAVQERTRRGSPRYLYALRVGQAQPDFSPVVFHETPNEPSCPVLRQGGTAFYECCLNRRDGFNGSATIEAEGLPHGVNCSPAHVGPNNELTSVVFTAAPDAPEWTGAIRLKAWAMIGDKRVERPVIAIQRRFSDQSTGNASRAGRVICLAVRPTAPYALKVAPDEIKVKAGAMLETKAKLARHWADFKGAVRLSAWKPPTGFEAGDAEIPAGGSEATIKVRVSADVPPGVYSIVIRGDAQVPFSSDPSSPVKPSVRVADPAPPLRVVVSEPPRK